MVMISLGCMSVKRMRWRCPMSADRGASLGQTAAKMVYGTKEFEYTHRWTLLVIETAVCFLLSYQERFPYPELTLITPNHNASSRVLYTSDKNLVFLAQTSVEV